MKKETHKKITLIFVLAAAISSVLWWSWAFYHMAQGIPIQFVEPIVILAWAEFAMALFSGFLMIVLIKSIINNKIRVE